MLEVKKMDFTELETLAVVATEMVRAQQDTETDLKERKLKILKLQAPAL